MRKQKNQSGSGCAAVVAVVIGIAWLSNLFDSGSGSSGDLIGAWVMAQGFVEDRLVAPSTADFGGVLSDYQNPKECVTHLGNDRYRVRGWVDSQNGFGAVARSSFLCELRDDGSAWTLTSISIW